MTVPIGKQANERCLTLETHVEELIPGIPNEITLDHITGKLSWTEIDVLFSVSRRWRHAIESRQVYDARVRCHSTETFALNSWPVSGTILYFYLDSATVRAPWIKLPPICSEYFGLHVPRNGRCATFDCKVYVFGGLDCKVHVLDVAGRRQWKECASMLQPRQEFGCGVIDGKIYVFGGAVNKEYDAATELYDLEESIWSPVRPIVSLRCGHYVPRVRDTIDAIIFRFSRYLYVNHFEPKKPCHAEDADLLEVYDPVKDEWGMVEPVGKPIERMFVAGGKFYSMNPLEMYVYDFKKNSWAYLHSFSFAGVGGSPVDLVEFWPVAFLCANDELLAMMDWSNANDGTNRSCLVRSRGLGSQNKEIVWQKANFAETWPQNYTARWKHYTQM